MRASQYNQAMEAIRMEIARAANDERGVVRFADLSVPPDDGGEARVCTCGCGRPFPAYSGHGREGQYATSRCRRVVNNRTDRKRKPPVPPPRPTLQICRCGCGQTWTRERRDNRVYATEQCRWRHSGQRTREAKKAGTWTPRARRLPVRCWTCRGPVGRDSEVVYCLAREACGWSKVVGKKA